MRKDHRTYFADNSAWFDQHFDQRFAPKYVIFTIPKSLDSKEHYYGVLNEEKTRYIVGWVDGSRSTNADTTDYNAENVVSMFKSGTWKLVNNVVESLIQWEFAFPSEPAETKVADIDEPVIELVAVIDEQHNLMYANVYYDEEYEQWGVRSSDYNGNITDEFRLVDHAGKGMEAMLKVAQQIAAASLFAGISITADNVVIE